MPNDDIINARFTTNPKCCEDHADLEDDLEETTETLNDIDFKL